MINSEHYTATLKQQLQEFEGVRMFFCNMPMCATVEAIERMNLTILTHPSYIPDLAPCDYHLFPKLKEDGGHQYASNEKV
jgi:hypothetical protein